MAVLMVNFGLPFMAVLVFNFGLLWAICVEIVVTADCVEKADQKMVFNGSRR